MKIYGLSPEIREPFLAQKNPCHPRNLCDLKQHPAWLIINCQLSIVNYIRPSEAPIRAIRSIRGRSLFRLRLFEAFGE